MITRKIAKQVMEQWERDKQQYGVVVVKTFIDQFTDELTPDEMLAEMRDWAKNNSYSFFYREWTHNCSNKNECGLVISNTKTRLKLLDLCKEDRTEAITEAYRQFKEATK